MNSAVQVLIAAIKVTTTRGVLIGMGGAGREWTRLESAGDRRECERVRTGSAEFRRPTRAAAADDVQPLTRSVSRSIYRCSSELMMPVVNALFGEIWIGSVSLAFCALISVQIM